MREENNILGSRTARTRRGEGGDKTTHSLLKFLRQKWFHHKEYRLKEAGYKNIMNRLQSAWHAILKLKK